MKWTDINKLMWVFEANYDRLLTLVPRLDELNGLAKASVDGLMDLHLEILDRSRYTTTISLTHYLNDQGRLVANPYMRVRLYHDAKVAEVLAYQNQSRFRHEYPYPNPKMHQRHEKRQLNLFLAEWLTYCIARGYRFDTEPSYSDI